MISASGKWEIKFELENFQVDKNDFSRNFLGHQTNGKAFAKRYREIASSSAIAITPSTSGALANVAADQGTTLTNRTLQKTPGKKAKDSRKRKTATLTPEGAELPSPANLYKPNAMDEAIDAHYLGMLPFYNLTVLSDEHICLARRTLNLKRI